jgi:GAF domain-containing protein
MKAPEAGARMPGVRARLLIAFFAISAFAVLAAAAGIYAFREVGGRLAVIETRVPPTLSALELSRSAERIIAAAPALLAATDRARRDAVKAELGIEVDRLNRRLLELRNVSAQALPLQRTEPVVSLLTASLGELDSLVARRLETSERIAELRRGVFRTSADVQRLLAPWLEVMEKQISALVEPNQKAAPIDGNDRAAQLASLIRLQRQTQTAQRRVSATVDMLAEASTTEQAARIPILNFQLGLALRDLDETSAGLDPKLRPLFLEQVAKLRKYVEGPNAVAEARGQELALMGEGEQRLAETAKLSAQLAAAVAQLGNIAKQDIGQAIYDALLVQRLSARVLVTLVVLSLFTSILIVWLYVGGNIVRRLTALSDGMLAIAGGKLHVPVATEGGDEIAAMARAVEVFRRNAIELERLLEERKEAAARLERVVEERTRDLSESLEYQTAMSDVLNVISRSPTQLQPVLDVIVNTAARLCAAEYSYIAKYERNSLRYVAHVRVSDEHLRFLADPIRIDRGAVIGRVALERRTVHVPDVLADSEFDRFEWQKVGKQRTVLGVPLLREDTLVGVIILARTSVAPFTEKQIELVTTFADQAVIAIENARLFDEVQARTHELTETLEQQTATAEILRVISISPTDAQPVFETIVRNAVSLCDTLFANVFRFDGEWLHFVASHNVGPDYVELLRTKYPMRPDSSQVSGRVLLTKSVVRLEDVLTDPDYDQRFPAAMGWRRMLGVPMLRKGDPIGVIVVGWAEPGPIPAIQEELLKTFADQAVIAIENARLFDEVQARTRELSEALEQQTATSEILRTIASSPGDAQPVFDTVARSVARLCDVRFCQVFRFDGKLIHFAAHHGLLPEAVEDIRGTYPMTPGRGSAVARAILRRAVEQIPDIYADPDYGRRHLADLMNFRSVVAVPMLKEGRPIGAIAMARAEPGHFPEQQIELLRTFRDQAVIAIENARLFDEAQARTRELSEALEYQTATSEVLNVISRSPTQLQPVLDAIVQTAARLCSAEYSFVTRYADSKCYLVAANRVDADHIQYLSRNPVSVDRGSVTGRVAIEKKTMHVADVLADPEFNRFEWQKVGKQRTILGVPLLREGNLIGVMILARTSVAPFTEKQIELVTTFADQAVIAIENARLFDEIQDKSRQLEIADKYKSHFLASASHDLRQPLHALNLFVAQLHSENDPAESERLVSRIDAAVASMNELFESLLDMSKLEAGILEPHFTEFPIQRVFKRIETTFVDAAKQKGLRLAVVPSTAWIRSDVILFERILMNLVSNAVRYTSRGGVVVGCRRRGEQLRVDVCDSGPGIAEEQQQSIFAEYYRLGAVEPDRGGGFGLGLAIVDRLGQLLGHKIELTSRPAQGSRFSVAAPLAAEQRAAAEAPATSALPDPARGKLVLVIDDDALVLEGMGGMLRSWGCDVLTADSEESALSTVAAGKQPPDLIISDYRLMNGKTGIEVIERLRGTLGASIPAFLISGDTAPERLRDASESGFHLLHKPVAPMRLRAVLNQLLRPFAPRAAKPAKA